MRSIILICSVLIFGTLSGFAQNYQIKQITTMNGQRMESTVYVKGLRKRSETGAFMGIGGDVADIEQCDLKRTVKINDKRKIYYIDPFEVETPATPATTKPTAATVKPAPMVKGGVVTYVSNIVDTGERKQMFGFTARHIKTSLKVESSPDACTKSNMTMETDGWYIDLPEFACPYSPRRNTAQSPETQRGGGCRDRIQFRTTGTGKLGFPLTETRTMTSDGMSFSQTTETLELSKKTLDAALFDIPAGYAQITEPNELYGPPDLTPTISDEEKVEKTRTDGGQTLGVNRPEKKKPGTVRIGVYVPTNRTTENVSATNLQAFLILRLIGGTVDAVAVSSEADASAAQCDYVLTSDISKLKQSTASKIGGILGKVTNTDTSSAQKFDAQVDFKLVALSDGRTVIQNKSSGKTDGSADKAAESVLAMEVQQVLSAVRK